MIGYNVKEKEENAGKSEGLSGKGRGDSGRKRRKKGSLNDEIIDTLDTIEEDYNQFRNTISSLKSNLKIFMDETEEEIRGVEKKAEEKAEEEMVKKEVSEVEHDVEEVDEQLSDVMEEVGYGKGVDIGKVPPAILKDIYQETLDDVVQKIHENTGSHDTRVTVENTLRKMRNRTSGSELFQYEGQRIKIRNLISSIKNELISSKQIHSTYQELLSKLVELVPGYEPPNFRAKINSKGLEFAIEKSVEVDERTEEMAQNISYLKKDISELSDEMGGQLDDLFERFGDVEEEIEEMVEKTERIEELEEKNRNLEDRMGGMVEEVEALHEKVEEKGDVMSKEEKFVYYSLPDNGATLKSIQGDIGNRVEDAENSLEGLIDKGKVKKEERGRWTVYLRKSEEGVQEEEEKDEGETVETEEAVEQDLEETMEEVEGEEVEEEDIEGVEKEIEEEEAEIEETDEDTSREEVGDLKFDAKGFEELVTKEIEKEEDGGEVEPEEEIEEVEEKEGEAKEGREEHEGMVPEEEGVEEEEMGGGEGEEVEEKMEDGEKGERKEEEMTLDLDEDSKTVLAKIPEDGCTVHKLNRNIEDLDKSEIQDVLDELEDEDHVSTTKRNRWTIYMKNENMEVG